MAFLRNWYFGSEPFRDIVNTAASGVLAYGVTRVAGAVISQVSNDPTIDNLCQLADPWAPFVGFGTAAYFAGRSRIEGVRRSIRALAVGGAAYSLGTGVENTDPSVVGDLVGSGIERAVSSLQPVFERRYNIPFTDGFYDPSGSETLGAAGAIMSFLWWRPRPAPGP